MAYEDFELLLSRLLSRCFRQCWLVRITALDITNDTGCSLDLPNGLQTQVFELFKPFRLQGMNLVSVLVNGTVTRTYQKYLMPGLNVKTFVSYIYLII